MSRHVHGTFISVTTNRQVLCDKRSDSHHPGRKKPPGLAGLKAAAFIAKSLSNAKDMDWIAAQFNGDGQLVDMWTSFIYHNNWVRLDVEGKWSLTDKGKSWVNKMMKGLFLSPTTSLVSLFAEFNPPALLLI